MEKLVWLVGSFNLVIEYILLMAVDRLSGLPSAGWKKGLCACAAGLHGALCLMPGYEFLGQPLWRWGILLVLGCILYFPGGKALPRLSLMLLLNFGVEGFQRFADQEQLFTFAAAGILVAFICVLCFRGEASERYVSVELRYEGKTLELTALVDTGNRLTDPVTGEAVLIISHKAAYALTGLERQQLASPLATMEEAVLPGLRLIPYHSVGEDNGMLLALRLTGCKVAGKEKDLLVAFSPAGLGKEGCFQALTGGVL